MLELLKTFNSDYANAVSAITPFVLAIASWLYFKVYAESKQEKGSASEMVGPVFWALGNKYKVLACHQYAASDQDVSGYKHLGQNSRPDQWQKLIRFESRFFNLRHEIIPIDSSLILTAIVSRDGKEKWRSISFNKL
jgi:hypothetical protein